MFKYKKITFHFVAILFVILSIIELIIYLFNNNTIFGLYYLLINLLIIFFLLPCAYNYKKNYSAARNSKLIIIIILGIFNSFLLKPIVLNNVGYTDDSIFYLDKIFIIKNVLKIIIYAILAVICFLEYRNKQFFMKNKKLKIK